MYLRFEDWSSFTSWLDARGVKHGGKIIKAYPSEDDPREKYNKSTLVVIESDDSPFTEQDLFPFRDQGEISGEMGFRFVYIQPYHDSKLNHIVNQVNHFLRC